MKILHKNYLIIFEHVDKLSRKNIYLKKILDLGYKFGLCEPPSHQIQSRFTITLITYFTSLDLKILQIWITIIIFYRIWTLKYFDYRFGFQFLFCWIWTGKHLDYEFGLR